MKVREIMENKLQFALALLLCASLSSASITITRTAPLNVTLGETFAVEIKIQNSCPAGSAIVKATVKEKITGLQVLEQPLVKQETYYDPMGKGEAGPTSKYLEWKLQLACGEIKQLSYHLTAANYQPIILPPTQVYAGGKTYYGIGQAIHVLCFADSKCDLASGENYQNCPSDCPTGIADGICDLAADGKNDPDCEYGFDPDYSPSADTDLDGVPDSSDKCPLTSQNEKADSSGCSCSQKRCEFGCIAATGKCSSPPAEPQPPMQEKAQPEGNTPILAAAALAGILLLAVAFRLFRKKKK